MARIGAKAVVSRFLLLPQEFRDLIYEYLVPKELKVAPRCICSIHPDESAQDFYDLAADGCIDVKTVQAIRGINRQIRDEWLEVLSKHAIGLGVDFLTIPVLDTYEEADKYLQREPSITGVISAFGLLGHLRLVNIHWIFTNKTKNLKGVTYILCSETTLKWKDQNLVLRAKAAVLPVEWDEDLAGFVPLTAHVQADLLLAAAAEKLLREGIIQKARDELWRPEFRVAEREAVRIWRLYRLFEKPPTISITYRGSITYLLSGPLAGSGTYESLMETGVLQALEEEMLSAPNMMKWYLAMRMLNSARTTLEEVRELEWNSGVAVRAAFGEQHNPDSRSKAAQNMQAPRRTMKFLDILADGGGEFMDGRRSMVLVSRSVRAYAQAYLHC